MQVDFGSWYVTIVSQKFSFCECTYVHTLSNWKPGVFQILKIYEYNTDTVAISGVYNMYVYVYG